MLKTALMTTAMTLALSAPAFAAHCPKDAAAIDAALARMSVSEETRAKVQDLRDQGMAAHEAGDHRQSESTLAEAMRLLLNADN